MGDPLQRSVDQMAATAREQMSAEVRELTLRWARLLMGLGPDDDLPADQTRLALLTTCEVLRKDLAELARQTATDAAAAGAGYGALGAAVGMTRQGARRRWPGLATDRPAVVGPQAEQ